MRHIYRMPPHPGDLCVYFDEGETPKVLLTRVLVYLQPHPTDPDVGIFLGAGGTLTEEFFVFLRVV